MLDNYVCRVGEEWVQESNEVGIRSCETITILKAQKGFYHKFFKLKIMLSGLWFGVAVWRLGTNRTLEYVSYLKLHTLLEDSKLGF